MLQCTSPPLAHLYGPAARCKPKNDDLEKVGLALLYPAY